MKKILSVVMVVIILTSLVVVGFAQNNTRKVDRFHSCSVCNGMLLEDQVYYCMDCGGVVHVFQMWTCGYIYRVTYSHSGCMQ